MENKEYSFYDFNLFITHPKERKFSKIFKTLVRFYADYRIK